MIQVAMHVYLAGSCRQEHSSVSLQLDQNLRPHIVLTDFQLDDPSELAYSFPLKTSSWYYFCPPCVVVGTPPATWLTIPASSPMRAQEDCAQLTLVYTLLVSRTRTNLGDRAFIESETICRRTSDCHIALSDSRWKHFGTRAQCQLI